eukprot:TRINITY_DN12478_c0_g1_i1.p1 TRINITY_DN12478_c0_g1~~TRINITY_DN12478_c0_g1_i1.p1  ORF type:complete len:179 (-),score=59.28 TRINITY_DN12478_c0_g1_i1:23-559(-)
MSWTIESWAKFEENFERSQKEGKKKIVFNENSVYQTIYLSYSEYLPQKQNEPKKIESKRQNPKRNKMINSSDNKKNKNVENSNVINFSPQNENENKNKTHRMKKDSNFKKGGMLKEWQYEHLLKVFEVNNLPNTTEIEDISKDLKITFDKVKNWFQNHRAKLRRNNQLNLSKESKNMI